MIPADITKLTGAGRIQFSSKKPCAPLPGNIVPCLLCGKPFLMPFFIGEPDQVCGECMKTYKDTAKVVCVKCRMTVFRVEPKLLESGFYIRPRSILHTNQCGICNPDLKESEIVEIAEWERSMGHRKVFVGMS